MYFRRTTTADTVLGGKEIKAGDSVVLWYISANRDETHFEAPRSSGWTARRTSTSRSAVAVRTSASARTWPARRSTRCSSQVLSRLDDLQLAGDVQRLRSNFINGIKHMPVTFTPGKKIGSSAEMNLRLP